MAAGDAKPVPIKDTAYRVTFPILDADGDLVAGATSLDAEFSEDAATFADCTNESTQIATSSGMYYLDVASTEMGGDTVAIIAKSAEGKTTPIVLYPQSAANPINVNVQAISTDSTAADNAEAFFDGTGYAGTNNVIPTVSSVTAVATGGITAGSIAADAIGASELAADAVTEIAAGVWGADATTYQAAGTFGLAIGDPTTDGAGGIYKGTVTDAAGTNVAADIIAMKADTAAILVDTGTDGVIVASLGATAKSDVKAEVVDALATDTYAESAGVPAATASLSAKIQWLATLARNKITQTATTQTLRNDADSGNIATSTVSDDATTATRGEWV